MTPDRPRRHGRRARAVPTRTDPALPASSGRRRSDGNTSGELPILERHAVAPPGPGEPRPKVRLFGRRKAETAPPITAEEAVVKDVEVDGTEFGEIPQDKAPAPRPAPRFEGPVLRARSRFGDSPLFWMTWIVIALVLIALIILITTTSLLGGDGGDTAAMTANLAPQHITQAIYPTHLPTHLLDGVETNLPTSTLLQGSIA
ncbi:hypothetical protein [Devriesea agamarum]|uniref:hypothetical protein n=1 Tax=Devriesea agamarum TaxID=472569 RepID=UPI0012ED269C|nr:hypothetical protein [Devriesea agamarum]